LLQWYILSELCQASGHHAPQPHDVLLLSDCDANAQRQAEEGGPRSKREERGCKRVCVHVIVCVCTSTCIMCACIVHVREITWGGGEKRGGGSHRASNGPFSPCSVLRKTSLFPILEKHAAAKPTRSPCPHIADVRLTASPKGMPSMAPATSSCVACCRKRRKEGRVEVTTEERKRGEEKEEEGKVGSGEGRKEGRAPGKRSVCSLLTDAGRPRGTGAPRRRGRRPRRPLPGPSPGPREALRCLLS
jgi:hypothetical protein